MDKLQWGHWVSTGLLTAIIVASGVGYLLKTDEVAIAFTALEFPTWLIIPMGLAKLGAAIMLWWKPATWITEWTYAGLNFNFFLAASAHFAIADNEYLGAIVALILLYTSYSTWKYLQKRQA